MLKSAGNLRYREFESEFCVIDHLAIPWRGNLVGIGVCILPAKLRFVIGDILGLLVGLIVLTFVFRLLGRLAKAWVLAQSVAAHFIFEKFHHA
ncbi:hypothetical protein N9P96_00110 [bacterium]|nr:hypothetical protein [bacterium]